MQSLNQILKNIRVSARLQIVVGLGMVALIAIALITMSTLGAVKIGGSTERQINDHNAMLADIVPPGATLAPIDLWVMEAKDSLANGDTAGVADAIAQIEPLVAQFRERHQYWQEHADTTEAALFADIADSGDAYLAIREDAPVLTADRIWSRLPLDLTIEVLRP